MRYKFQFFLLLAVHVGFVLSQSENFALLAQRQMQSDIDLAEAQINLIADRYQDLINILVYRQQKTYELIQEVNQNLILKEIVDPDYRACIQTHKSDLYSKSQAERKFNACHTVSEERKHKFLLDVDTPFRNARNIANVQWPMSVEKCLTSIEDSPEDCVVSKAEAYFWAFNGNMNDVQDMVEMNYGTLSVIARNAMECSFYAEKRILMKLGGVMQMIDICLEAKHLPPISEELLFS